VKYLIFTLLLASMLVLSGCVQSDTKDVSTNADNGSDDGVIGQNDDTISCGEKI